MKILVCIKQVPDLESRFKPDASGVWFDETDLAWRMNEYDEYAIEEAVRLKEQLGGEPEVTVLSIGPDRVVEPIKKALAMGGDRGVQVKDDASFQKDPWQIASVIAAYAKGEGFDLVFTGLQSQDRGSAQVGVLLAELLAYACASTVVGFSYHDGAISAKRELEGGLKGVLKLAAPAVITCQLGLNVPRYPTLPNIMKAKKKEIRTVAVTDLLDALPFSTTESFHQPARKGGGVVLAGETSAMVDQLIAILKDKTALLR